MASTGFRDATGAWADRRDEALGKGSGLDHSRGGGCRVAPVEVSDDDFGGGGSSDGEVDDGSGSAASTSSSTASSVPSSPDTSEQQEDLDDELDALPCLACGKTDDIPNTLLCARPIGRKEDGRFCDKAYHVRCTDLEDVPEGDVSEYTVKTDSSKLAILRLLSVAPINPLS